MSYGTAEHLTANAIRHPFSKRNLYPISECHLHAAVQIDRHPVNRRVPKLCRKNCNWLVVCQYSIPESFDFSALTLASGAFRVNLLDPIRRLMKTLRQAVILSGIFFLVKRGAGVLTHDLPDEFGYDTHLDLQSFLFRIQFRRVDQLSDNRLHILRDEAPLRQQLIEGRQKLLLNHQFAQVRRLASSSFNEPGVALPDGASVFVVGMPDLAAVHAATATTVNSPREAMLAVVLAA